MITDSNFFRQTLILGSRLTLIGHFRTMIRGAYCLMVFVHSNNQMNLMGTISLWPHPFCERTFCGGGREDVLHSGTANCTSTVALVEKVQVELH